MRYAIRVGANKIICFQNKATETQDSLAEWLYPCPALINTPSTN